METPETNYQYLLSQLSDAELNRHFEDCVLRERYEQLIEIKKEIDKRKIKNKFYKYNCKL